MENRKRFIGTAARIGVPGIIALAVMVTLATAACASSSSGAADAPDVLEFGSAQIEARQASAAPEAGTADGAYYFSNAKTALESGTYEILLTAPSSVDVRPYKNLVFELSADNLDLLDDLRGLYPRLRTGSAYTQFKGTEGMQNALGSVTEDNQWATVTVSIDVQNAHERAEDFRSVMPRVDSLMFRFICADMENIDGRIYLRNIRFTK